MNQAAFHTSAPALDSHDFNHNYRYIKKLIQALKAKPSGEQFAQKREGGTIEDVGT